MLKSFMLICFCFVLLSCEQKSKFGNPVKNPSKNFSNLINYLIYQRDFMGMAIGNNFLDINFQEITKKDFMAKIGTGKYIPLQLISNDSLTYYQLYKFEETVDKDINNAISQWGKQDFAYFQTEGKELPNFNFVDLSGNIYTKQNTKGKILVLKCWFLACSPCVKEIPELNVLVEKYKNQKDIIFVSIAKDEANEVKNFLSKHPFSYANVAGKTKYLEDSLAINSYPMHFVIDRKGLIVRKTNDHKVMEEILKREILK